MAISFECAGCGKPYTVRDDFAGKLAQCKQCGQRMTIPSELDSDGYGLDAPVHPSPAEPEPEAAPLPPMRWASKPSSSRRPLYDPPKPEKKGFFSFGSGESMGATGVLIAIALIGLRVYLRMDRAQNQNMQIPQANFNAPPQPNFGGGRPAADRSGPILLPNFPDPGSGREIEPGVTLHEIKLGPARPPFGSTPGHGGKLWLYLPSGEHQPRSLPCILITGAGSTIVTGMDLANEDRAEHLPYARAGFAVLAFELDGVPRNKEQPTNQDLGEAMSRFLNARSGLVNAHIALEYVLAKVPQVDPSKISAAGHSSAGTLAVLFAEHEPRLKASVAYAPALDLENRFGQQRIAMLRRAGVGDLATLYSPKNNEDKLTVPLFLFHAEDDSNISAEMSKAFANDLKAKGKSITLDIVPAGNHYDSMINEGIPHAIAWLNEQGAGPGR